MIRHDKEISLQIIQFLKYAYLNIDNVDKKIPLTINNIFSKAQIVYLSKEKASKLNTYVLRNKAENAVSDIARLNNKSLYLNQPSMAEIKELIRITAKSLSENDKQLQL